MTVGATLLFLFFSALGLSLALTPVVRALGSKLGAMDIPHERKVHTTPTPRIGGLAVLLASLLTLYISSILIKPVADLFVLNSRVAFGFGGMLVVFGCGLWDDFRHLNSLIKLLFQILAATLAFSGGFSINAFLIGSHGFHFGFLTSYLLTVFWFLLFINAVNLIDGLDGLASGVVFFASVLMAFLSYMNNDYLTAFYFTVLGGALLGFLRYNFNPASIFLGDGGSYFLGYTVAILAIRSSMKSQAGALMLIPLLALGVPIFDTLLSPLRRWIIGRGMFHPDKGHIHHHFLRMGLSSRNAVLLIYGITMFLCVISILLVTFRGRLAQGLGLALLLLGMILLVRKLGYLDYLAVDKFYGWFQDMTDVVGFSKTRRSFLSMQIAMNKSQTMDELWDNVVDALEILKFNEAQLCLDKEPTRAWTGQAENQPAQPKIINTGSRDVCIVDNLMKMEIPLTAEGGKESLGKLILIKDLNQGELKFYTIRRVEHLRRSLIANIDRLKNVKGEKIGY